MIIIPHLSAGVLPEYMRTAHKKVVDSAIEQGVKALEEIKAQFGNKEINYEKLMKAIGIFFQQSSYLNSQRR